MAEGQQVITALIIPLSSASPPPRPTPTPPGQQPGIDNTLPGDLPRPEHPIYFPLPPGAPVDPDYGISIEQPDNTLPPGVDNTLPGQQPGTPTNPIVLPPDEGGGWLPVYIWGGGPGVRPPLPIPPEGETEDGRQIKFVCGWTPSTGWISVAVVVPEKDHVTPSRGQRRK